MVMGYLFTGLVGISILSALLTGQGSALAPAAMQGAQEGIQLAIAIGGGLCLWSGVGKLLEISGVTPLLARLLRPGLYLLFPDSRRDSALGGYLSGNILANFLGLGNAATPMGIRAAQRLAQGSPGIAGDQLCRLVVLNTASIQFLPTTVAAIRSSLGCGTPFDILPAVWLTSLLSAGLGLGCTVLLGKVWKA